MKDSLRSTMPVGAHPESNIAKSVLYEGKQRREQKHELSNRICRHRRPFGAMIDRPAFAMGSAAHRRTPSSGQRRDGERSDVRPCACCGRTRRAEPTRCTRIRAAYSRSSGSCSCSSSARCRMPARKLTPAEENAASAALATLVKKKLEKKPGGRGRRRKSQ